MFFSADPTDVRDYFCQGFSITFSMFPSELLDFSIGVTLGILLRDPFPGNLTEFLQRLFLVFLLRLIFSGVTFEK